MSNPKPIIVMTPEAFTPALRERAEEAGYCVLVTSRPDEVHVLDFLPVGVAGAIAQAAYATIKTDGYGVTRQHFGTRVADAMLKLSGEEV